MPSKTAPGRHLRRSLFTDRRHLAGAALVGLSTLLMAAASGPAAPAADAPSGLTADQQAAIAQGDYNASQVAVSSAFLASFANNLKTMADWGTVLTNLRDLKLPDNASTATIDFFNQFKPYQSTLGPAGADRPVNADLLAHAYDLIDAVKQDLARPSADPMSTVLSSHTLETLSSFGLDWLTRANSLKSWSDAGMISEPFGKYAGFLSFGAQDIATWVGQGVGTGKWWSDPDVVSHLLDGLNRGSWAAVGFLASGGDRDVAEAFSGAAGFIAPFVRDHTLDFFADQYMRQGGVNQAIMDQYTQAQQSLLARNQKLQSFEEFVGNDPAVLRSVGRDAMAAADARFGVRPPSDPTSLSVVTRTMSESYREVCLSGFCTRADLTPPQPKEGGVRINSKPVLIGRPPAGLGAKILGGCGPAASASCTIR